MIIGNSAQYMKHRVEGRGTNIGNDKAKLDLFTDAMTVRLAKAYGSALRRLGTLMSPKLF